MVTVPDSPARMRRPVAKSTMSGTCANTLLAATRSALPCRSTKSLAVASPTKATVVSMPFARAASATLAAGSMPWHRMPRACTCWSR